MIQNKTQKASIVIAAICILSTAFPISAYATGNYAVYNVYWTGLGLTTPYVPTGDTITHASSFQLAPVMTVDTTYAPPNIAIFTKEPGHVFVVNDIGGGSGSIDLAASLNTWPAGLYVAYDTSGNYIFIYWAGSSVDHYDTVAVLTTDTHTRIDTVSPYDHQTIATSSLPWNFETIGYINSDDYKPGARIRIKVDRDTDNQSIGALQAYDSAFGNYTYLPITASGTFDISTTTLITLLGFGRIGDHHMTQDVQVPGIGVHWWFVNFDLTYNNLVSTSTQFTVGTSTSLDVITSNATDYLNAVASSTGDSLASCQFNWFSSAVDFSLGSNLLHCVGGLVVWLVVPQPGVIGTSFTQLQNGMLVRAPWGYITRFVNITLGGAVASTTDETGAESIMTWTAPVYTQNSTTPDINLTFDMMDMFDGGAATLGSIRSNTSNKSMREIFEPYIQLFIALAALIIIVTDLMHMGHHTIRR